MAKIYSLPNRVMAEVNSKIFEHPYILNFLYYTGLDSCNEDLFTKKKPSIGKILNKNYVVGRRIRYTVTEVGAYICSRVKSYSPQYQKSKMLIKEVYVDIDVIVHDDCQQTIHGTRDLTLVALIQEALEQTDLTGIAPNCEIYGMSEILGLSPHFSGYCLTIKVTGFNEGLYGNY